MFEWAVENWVWTFIGLWLFGAWALTLPFGGRTPVRRAPLIGPIIGYLGAGSYVRLEYRIPARTGRTLEKIARNNPEARTQHLRAAFFLLYGASFRPHAILNDWFGSTHWKEQRDLYRREQIDRIQQSLQAIRRNQLSDIYEPREASLVRPLALSYPLLPRQFSLFLPVSYSARYAGQRSNIPAGMYRCEVVDWSEENSYAESIRLQSVLGDTYHMDQISVLDAIRQRRAAVESVSFLGLPVFIYAGKKRSLPKLLKEQKVAGRLPIRAANVRDFGYLDRKLIKVFGGANPANLLRLSWFYHPSFGVKPDESKHRRLVERADRLAS